MPLLLDVNNPGPAAAAAAAEDGTVSKEVLSAGADVLLWACCRRTRGLSGFIRLSPAAAAAAAAAAG
jgi:hypothetical protein